MTFGQGLSYYVFALIMQADNTTAAKLVKTALKIGAIAVPIRDNRYTENLEHVSHLICDSLKPIKESILTPNLAAIFEECELFRQPPASLTNFFF
jgi:hypothetical protein